MAQNLSNFVSLQCRLDNPNCPRGHFSDVTEVKISIEKLFDLLYLFILKMTYAITFKVLKLASNIEIFVKFWIFVFFYLWDEKKATVHVFFFILGCLPSNKRYFNSKEIQLQSSLRVICTSFRFDFFQLKKRRKKT